MKEKEYEVIVLNSNTAEAAKRLNIFARVGWQVVGTLHGEFINAVILERDKASA